MKIGEFSKLSRVSIRMLRHYDQMGVLRPERTDPATGYRHYGAGQLVTMNRITALRAMGVSLAEIRDLNWEDREALEGLLRTKREETAAEVHAARQRLVLLDTALEGLRKESPMKYDVLLKTLPERHVASVRRTIPRYEREGELWQILMEETAPLGLRPTESCRCSVTFHDKAYKETDVDVEVQMTVDGAYPDTAHVRFKTVPAVMVASCTYRGGYHQMGAVNEAVAAWVEANGYAFDGPMFNIYHVSPHETADPAQYVTEVCSPVVRG